MLNEHGQIHVFMSLFPKEKGLTCLGVISTFRRYLFNLWMIFKSKGIFCVGRVTYYTILHKELGQLQLSVALREPVINALYKLRDNSIRDDSMKNYK